MSRIDKAIELATKAMQEPALPPVTPKPEGVAPPRASLAEAGFDRLKPVKVDNPLFAPLADPNGMAAEQYKKLRSMLIRKISQNGFRNTLLVTSAVAGEGKSLTALNLALTLARAKDYSVVLVDTDLRKPQMHLLLGITPKSGLVHHLRDGVATEKIIYKVGLGNLSLIPAGEALDDPLELLTSKRMQALVAELKGRYPDRFVLLDTPPTLPFADLQTLGELVDNILFVCREGYSSLKQIEQGLAILLDYNLLGIVCNDASMAQSMDYSHYYGMK